MTKTCVSERDLFHALSGFAMHASLKRTLAQCLFWMQHATHEDDGLPTIWKTGPELERELSIDARTANRHLKKLRDLGFWSITYRPKPGGISKVTWLTIGDLGSRVLSIANEQLRRSRDAKRSADGRKSSLLSVLEPHVQTSHAVTSKQSPQAQKTAKGTAKFLLSGSEKKEALQTNSKLPGCDPVPTKHVKADVLTRSFAVLANECFGARSLVVWDWSSAYTWRHLRDVVTQLQDRGLNSEEGWGAFLNWTLDEWHWVRSIMDWRYADHKLNLHAPSPMALAHQFKSIFAAFESSTTSKPLPTFSSSLDEGFS